ncbi:MAG: glycosyltransferase family 39 protein [Planctomycetes bacterium]|nr:glycosyltransferase family 39 protein [Planctomycetota bacterium]
MPQQLRQGLTIIAVAAAVYFVGLGGTRLWDDDETYFAQTAREMYERGDWIVPWFNQTLFAHKPPFMYWMMIAGYHLFGVGEFASRFPSALFGIASALLVWRLGRILYSPRAGYWAGIILSTSLNYVVIARAATCDAELLFFCTLSLYVFVRATAQRRVLSGIAGDSQPEQAADAEARSELVWLDADADRLPSWTSWMLIYAVMGVAVMVKGPIGVVLPTAVLGLFLLMQNRSRNSTIVTRAVDRWLETSTPGSLRSRCLAAIHYLAAVLSPTQILKTIWQMRPLTAVAMVLLVAGPWFYAVSVQTRGEFLEGFFGVHHFHRFTAGMDNHAGPPYFYLLAICVGFFPWIIFLTPTLQQLATRLKDPNLSRPADRLVIAWFTVWVGAFSLAVTKFPHYVLPAYPALALVTAVFLDRWIAQAQLYVPFWRRAACVTVAVVGVGILIVVPIVARVFLPGEELLGLAGIPLILGAAVLWRFTERLQIERALYALTGTAAVFSVGLFAVAAVRVDQYQNTPPFAAAIRAHNPAGDARIGIYQCFRPGYVYYCNRFVEQFWDDQRAQSFLSERPANSFLITTLGDYERLKSTLPPEIGVLERSPWFLKTGETVVLLGDKSLVVARKSETQGSER